ncbi:MAG: hypothetical protein RL701_616 [Pseudomonadota bacterium]|jgi:uncharacterized protein (DUF58 family)
MLPLPTPNALAAFVAACAMVTMGIAGSSALAVMLGSVVLIGLAVVFVFTLPVGARLRRDRLELAWWHTPHGEPVSTRGSVVAGARFDVQASLRHFGARPLVLSQLVPAHGAALRCVRGAQGAVVLPGQSRSEFELAFVAGAPGRLVLHGLSVMVHGPLDLFRAPLYFPIPLVVRALPRTAAATRVPLRESASVAAKRSGQALRRRPGGGTELRELRELVPGDAFKTIAWKASAKAGKLMVREMESEVQQTLYVVLDISGTMRGGAPGDRKLDYGIELAASLLRSALERGDQAGVITADGRVVAHAPAREGLAHMATLDEVLIGATEIIDADLTEPDDDEVVALVARYVRHQDGLDFRTANGFDLDGLARHARNSLTGEHELRQLSKQPIPTDPRAHWLRRFCRARGIELRYRPDTRGFAKAQGLAQALRAAAGGSRVPRTIIVVTDFDGVNEPAALEATLRMLRARQHAIAFVVPDAQSLLPRAASRLVSDLQLVYGLAETRRATEMRAFLYKLGIPLSVSARRTTARPWQPTKAQATGDEQGV